MKTWWLVIVFAVLMARGAAAQVEIRFETLPPDCQILWSSPSGLRRLPAKGGLVRLEDVDFGRVDKLAFTLLKPGYREHTLTIPTAQLKAVDRLRWPPEPGSFVRLEPLLVCLTIHTVPAGADVYLQEFPGSVQYLGRAEEELHLSLARVGGLAERGLVELILRRPGFHDTTVSLPATYLLAGRNNLWPVQGAVALSPRWWVLSPLYALVLQYPLGSVVALLGLGLVILRLSVMARALWRRTRHLEQKVAQAGISPDQLAGHRLGAHRLLRVLGQGGMATVYLGIPDESLNEQLPVAVKVLHRCKSQFRTEVRALQQLHHPNIVRLDDWGEFQGLLFLVLEYVPGPTLRSFVGASMAETAPLLRDTFAAVQHAHDMGVIHADLKPENVLVAPQGVAKVTDFGLAVLADETHVEDGGTLAYVAPERFLGLGLTPASDQFSLGRMALELLPPEDAICAVCQRMMRGNPEVRFASVQEAWEALEASLAVKGGDG